MTLQRQLILDAVRESVCHPSAAEVYDIVQKKHRISLATVYNNLNYLAESGQIMRVVIAGEADRFDGNVIEHQHAMCDNCGKVFDIQLAGIKEQLEARYSIKVTSFGINLHCICPDCGK